MEFLLLYGFVATAFTLVGFAISRWLKIGGALGRHRAVLGVTCAVLLSAGLVATNFATFNSWAGHFPDSANKATYVRRANWGTAAAILLFVSAGMVWPARTKMRDNDPS